MNRRRFLSALGAVATQQRLGRFSQQVELGCEEPPPIIFTVSRFPYVQNVRNDRASIMWATFELGFGQVRYTSDGVNFAYAPARSRFFSRNETGLAYDFFQYQADLSGLSPSTDY